MSFPSRSNEPWGIKYVNKPQNIKMAKRIETTVINERTLMPAALDSFFAEVSERFIVIPTFVIDFGMSLNSRRIISSRPSTNRRQNAFLRARNIKSRCRYIFRNFHPHRKVIGKRAR